MKKILVPTDFSQEAQYALEAAASLARKFKAEIFLLHMLDMPFSLIDPVGGEAKNKFPESIFYMKLAHKKFTELKQQEFLKDIQITEAVQFNYAFKGITAFANENNCDLIVMGSHGTSGFKDVFVGSNSEKVVRSSEKPVLVIKKQPTNFTIKKILLAIDKEIDNQNSLNKAINFAKLMNAELHLVFVNTPNNFVTSKEAYTEIEKLVKKEDLESLKTHIYNDVNIEEGILNFAEDLNADVIALSTHGRKGLAHFFNGSISEDVANHANKPVLTFKI
ncbi:universal stress protein [Zunongwangia sp.]|uniref:universal stress protein n=1 Tax=Zunongwangia sp. TaxID=1965325 RepID=UPI003AA7FE59